MKYGQATPPSLRSWRSRVSLAASRRTGRFKPRQIAVVGTGYVGLTTGACLAALGHRVICADVDRQKVARLQRGVIPIHEAGLPELVREGTDSGRLSFVLGAENAVPGCDVVFMCLPTPQGADGAADLSYLLDAAREIGPHLKVGAIVINKSTVPVGSAELVTRSLGNPSVNVASNPEFLRQGTAVYDFFHPERIVIGAERQDVAETIDRLFTGVTSPRVHVNTATAELMKYAANAFLAAKISYANSISTVSEALGANAHDVLGGMGRDSRIGAQFLQPGPGWGGSCFPKDTQALLHSSRKVDYEFGLLTAAIAANDAQSERIVAQVRRMAGGKLRGIKIAVWGLTFKAGTDDIRESPAIRIINRLVQEGAEVHAYDPKAKGAPKDITRHRQPLAACQGAQVLVVLTDWAEFRAISLEDVAARLKYPKIIDTRNVIDLNKAQELGIQTWSVSHTAKGRPRPAAAPEHGGNRLVRSFRYTRSIPGRIVYQLPDKYYTRAIFWRRKGALLHLKDPQTYSEKIQWLKVYGGLENYTNFVDKLEVRRHVEQAIGNKHLVPLLGSWLRFDDIPFDELPNQFVLKATHGHGYNFVCRDKSAIDMRALKIMVDAWTNENFYEVDREPQYKHVRPRLICEAYLEDDSHELIDYKIPCFGGEPHFIQVLSDRSTQLRQDFYDTKWNRLDIKEKGYPNREAPLPAPKQLGQMLELARTLSMDFPFVRVDFYLVNGKVYFGELTFTPANGMITYSPSATDHEMGKLLDLSRFSNETPEPGRAVPAAG